MKEKLKNLFFEDVSEETIIIKYKNKAELAKHIDDDLTKFFNEQHDKELKNYKKAKIIISIMPIIAILLFYITLYVSNIERFDGMSFISYIFKYSLTFYLSLIIYFNYLILVEIIGMYIYKTKFNAINNPHNSINRTFGYLLLEIICMILHIITLNNYHLIAVTALFITSLIMIYLHVNYLIKILNIAYKDLKGLV